ncbi:MAG: ABC transporter ATP-binding protein [bacterium]
MSMRGGGGGRFRHMGSEKAKPKAPLQSFKRILPWILPYWPIMLIGFICMMLTTYLGQQSPRVIAYTFDEVLRKNQPKQIPFVLLLFIGIYVFSSLFGFLRTYLLHIAGQRMLHQLRTTLYSHFQKMSLTYYDNKQTGDLMSRMTGDVAEIESLMVHGLDVLIMGVLGMVLAFFYMYRYQSTLALLVLIPVPFIVVSIYFFSRQVRTIYRAIRDRVGDLNNKLQENISGIRVIKAFSREETEMALVTTESANVRDMNIKGIRMWSTFGPAMGLISNIGFLTVIGVGSTMVLNGQLLIGQLTAFVMFVGNFYSPVGSLFQFFDSIQRSLAAGERILEVLDTPPDISDAPDALPVPAVNGEVEFRHVYFKYATGEEVLHDVNVVAHPGERIALVGRSGAGKSSFINLIPRFYDTLEGAVLIDGNDIRTLRQTELRKHIALVLQETFLFNGSVADNLRYGRLDATEEEIIAAAVAGNAHEFISTLPEGYKTEIGERGVKLSGGQRQRIAIARAVLANPRILILDEATSSVDSESEFLIHQALDRLMEGRTTFIIAHRLSTIRDADTILVLEDGSIIERGKHDALVESDGRYAMMYRQQFWLDDLSDTPIAGDVTGDDDAIPAL